MTELNKPPLLTNLPITEFQAEVGQTDTLTIDKTVSDDNASDDHDLSAVVYDEDLTAYNSKYEFLHYLGRIFRNINYFADFRLSHRHLACYPDLIR